MTTQTQTTPNAAGAMQPVTQRTVCVGYAYPTSPTANKLRFRAGCWYVVEMLGIGDTAEIPGTLRGYADKGEAVAHARATGLPFNRYSTTA